MELESQLLRKLRHELRTPINHIVGYSELWLEQVEDSVRPETLDDLRRIHAAGRELLRVVNEFLAPASIEVGNVELARLRDTLRTPLNTVSGYSELLIEDAADGMPAALVTDLHKVHAASNHLLTLVNSVIDLADIQHSAASEDGLPMTDKRHELINATPPPCEAVPTPRALATLSGDDARLLVVDDNETNRDILSRRLERLGYNVTRAADGQAALDELNTGDIDLVLLDVLMPGMNGYEVLERRHADKRLSDVPVIMISALDELDSVVRCIEMGAEDYLFKPFDPVLLRARIGACLEKKQLRDREAEYLRILAAEREKSEHLLLNILPQPIAERLKVQQGIIADGLPEVTALFADLVGFTKLSEEVSPQAMVEMLNRIFSDFDELAERYGVEKIKTMGDGYEIIAGAPIPRADHAEAVANVALGMRDVICRIRDESGWPLDIRIGIDSGGPVVAGVVGRKKFVYDVWGDTINTASRMESHSLPGSIQITERTYQRLRHSAFVFEDRGVIPVKSKGEMRTYFLRDKTPKPMVGCNLHRGTVP